MYIYANCDINCSQMVIKSGDKLQLNKHKLNTEQFYVKN
jgi:hypothetical protein